MPALARIASKVSGELPGAVADQEPEVPGVITEVHQEIAICWLVHGPSG
jgi:hypothetical protein